MVASKLVNRDEFKRWYEEGKSYTWIVEEYARKYNLEISLGTISNWRHQLGLPKRAVRDASLVPWAVERQHRYNHILQMLRTEARRRAGEAIPPGRAKKLESWLRNLGEQDAVVHYDPDTEQGWWLVPRRPGVDTDIIREPERKTRLRGARD
ncbi:hypothetical protein ACFOOK_26210 [Micromonospora krabiensis]|uniref:Uncharacterized protein n=1 Tax=Micromonospora krabiensis TaxID=307121 RepID=A0A1C3N5T0_9ACTN|nr:hypothetical protein [Micromonospora krabiensis]SBV27940.1 hypothetical protein GA0070620_3471 [Micromonospora krabiensis]